MSTAGHQVEGANTQSDFWRLEQLSETPFTERSGDAIDHLSLFQADIGLFAQLGFGAYRFSLEWSRIEPEQGQFSKSALAHYHAVLEACRVHDITPVVTLNHFTVPDWFAQAGGWLAPNAVDLYARYVEQVAGALGHLFGAACTLNEPNIIVQPAILARRAGGASATDHALMRRAAASAGASSYYSFFFVDGLEVRDAFLRAHRRGVEALKSGPGDYPVGVCLDIRDYQLAEDTPEAKRWYDDFVQEGHVPFYEAARGDDFIGVQNYSRRRVGSEGLLPVPEGVKRTQVGVEHYPQGLGHAVREAAALSGCPVIVTENGLPTQVDGDRVDFINHALRGVADAIADGVDVRGYFHWSAFDNFEWMSGYEPKFGLIEVDRTTQSRRPKPSAHHYGEIARTNGASLVDIWRG